MIFFRKKKPVCGHILPFLFALGAVLLIPGARCSAITAEGRVVGRDLHISVSGTAPGDEAEISTDGGRHWIRIGSGGLVMKDLSPGDYQLCARIKDDVTAKPRVQTIHIPGKGEKSGLEIEVRTNCEDRIRNGSIAVNIPSFEKGRAYMLSLDGGKSWRPATARSTRVTDLTWGYYDVVVACAKPALRSYAYKTYVAPRPLKKSGYLKVKSVLQLPSLPTGCEVTSLTMAINDMGISVSKETLADYYLEKDLAWTVSFRRKFAGDPRSKNSYGCYSPVIVNCANSFLSGVKGRSFEVKNLDGSSLDDLLHYVDMGIPVIAWVTIDMAEPYYTRSWTDLQTGEKVTWLAEEHCVLITGYNNEQGTIIVNDPLKGPTAYKRDVFEKRYIQLGKQAVVVYETTPGK